MARRRTPDAPRCSGPTVRRVTDTGDRVWSDSMPEAYERFLAPVLFEPFAADLARRVAAAAPASVLELAAGTGVLTRALAEVTGAAVTATDLAPPMVEEGARRAPGATWRQADALSLPFDDDGFDAVACQFGVMFFPDRRAALAEAHRVVRPGGRLVLSTWDVADANDFAAALEAGIRAAFPDDPPTFVVAVPHGYADPDEITADVTAAGFEAVAIEALSLRATAPSAASVARGFLTGTPLRGLVEGRADVDETLAVVTSVMEERLGTGPVTGRMDAYVVEATVPA